MRIEARANQFFSSMGLHVAPAKPCDYCKSSPALIFCKVDSAFTCIACDTKAHNNNNNGNYPHERVWICEVCEQAPAAFTCKADAAALCVACDRDIHSANPLAGRHERVPVVPFYDSAEYSLVMKPVVVDSCNNNNDNSNNSNMSVLSSGQIISDDTWMNSTNVVNNIGTHNHSNNNKFTMDNQDLKSLEFLFSDTDQLLDFDNYQQHPFSDSVVPVQTNIKPPIAPSEFLNTTHDHHHHLSDQARFEIDFTRSTVSSYNNSYTTTTNTTASLSHSLSSSSMDVGVVPDGSSISDISYPFVQNSNNNMNPMASGNLGMDREARVLRYKEKRKNRKFEKTIRYASRKAYAETRPRIKGRFAKRTDSESDLERIFSGDFIADARYGVVPSY